MTYDASDMLIDEGFGAVRQSFDASVARQQRERDYLRIAPAGKRAHVNGRASWGNKIELDARQIDKIILGLENIGFAPLRDAMLAPPPSIIREFLIERSLNIVAGAAQAGKSAFLDVLTICLALRIPFFGFEVRQACHVVLFLGEGFSTFPHRIRAIAKMLQIDTSIDQLPILPMNCTKPLLTEAGKRKAVEYIKIAAQGLDSIFEPRHMVAIFDTISTHSNMENENGSADAAKVCAAMSFIKNETGATVIGVHHFGKDPSKGERGSSAFRANVDCTIGLYVDRENKEDETSPIINRRAKVLKNRDGVEMTIGHFDIVAVQVGQYDDGEPYYAPAVQEKEAPEGQPGAKPRRPEGQAGIALKALEMAIDEAGEIPPATNYIPRGHRACPLKIWKTYAHQLGLAEGDIGGDAFKKAWQRATKRLQNQGFIGVWNEQAWLK